MEALEWDCNPDAYQLSDGALRAILAWHPKLREVRALGTAKAEDIVTIYRLSRQLTLRADKSACLDVLEIGCGTGILFFRLTLYVRSIVAIDRADDMINKLRAKITKHPGKGSNITPLCMPLEDPEDPALPRGIDGRCVKFDLVVSRLVLHHIADHASLPRTLHGCLEPGGQIALTDFEDFGPEARRFHPEGKMSDAEHQYGIKAERFACLMREAGFEDVSVVPAWTMDKEVETCPGE